MKTIKVNNLANFEFWVRMFRPRGEKWQRQTLKRLRGNISPLDTPEERDDKIKALEFLLNG